MKPTDHLKAFVSELLLEAAKVRQSVRQHEFSEDTVNAQMFSKLHAEYRLLAKKLGSYGEIWTTGIPDNHVNTVSALELLHGNLMALKNALDMGRLSTIQELVTAEILTDLLEQAEVLLAAKYHRAAAIILRTILEERLRKLCEAEGCFPTASKPTIEHYKQALYSATVIDKIVQKKIDWMAGVGNSAAHNLPEYREEDVPTLYKDTLDFLARFAA